MVSAYRGSTGMNADCSKRAGLIPRSKVSTRVKNDRNDRVKTIARLVFLARPAHEFPAAIRTNSIHGSCARYTEGTFEGADKGLTHWRECLMTPFAFRFHLECH